jgi:manganese/zinc/iron transport system permease protein
MIYNLWPLYLVFPLFFAISCLGFASGLVGSFLFLKRESMLADAISHAVFPGITCSFLLFSCTTPLFLLLGGIVSGYFGLYSFHLFTQKTTIKKETILGIILSSFFGLGLVIHSYIQKQKFAHQAVINKFLFGNAATMLSSEIMISIILSLCISGITIYLARTYFLLVFDPIFGKSVGYQINRYEIIFSLITIIMIALGLQIMGVILTGSLLIAPAAISRLYTKQQTTFLVTSGFLGSFCAILGTGISTLFPLFPTGPIIVIVLSSVLWGSVLLQKKKLSCS